MNSNGDDDDYLEDDDVELIGSTFNHLKYLNLKGNYVSDFGISMLEKSQSADTLEYLHVESERVSVCSFKNLKFLYCNNIVLKESEQAQAYHQLESLHIQHFGKKETQIQYFENLKYIHITGGSASIWNSLDNISNLEELSLRRYRQQFITTEKSCLSVFKRLKKLSVAYSSMKLGELEIIAKNLNLIECLKLVNVQSQGNQMIELLTDLKVIERLDTLDLSENLITDLGIEYLILKGNPEKLTSLGLSSSEITEKGVALIAECQKLRNLNSLTLHELKDYASLEHLMNGTLLNLKELDITDYSGPIKPLDDFFQSDFGKRLEICKHFKENNFPNTFYRDADILKTNPLNGDTLLQFMINGKYTESDFNVYTELIRDETHHFRVQLLCIDNLLPHHLGFLPVHNLVLEIRAEICYGTNTIIEACPHPLTFDYSKTHKDTWYFNFSKRLIELPFESVVKINLFVLDLSEMRKKKISQAIMPIFDKDRRHTFGIVHQSMCNIVEGYPKFGTDTRAITYFDRYNDTVSPFKGNMNEQSEILPSKKFSIDELMTKRFLTAEEKSTIWNWRQNIPQTQLGLKKLMESVPFMCFNSINYMRNYVKEISATFKTPYHYLELLGESFIDNEIRQIAYNVLNEMSDAKFLKSIEILVELLRFEIHVENPLSKLLLNRALGNLDIGRRLFWSIQGNIHNEYLREKLKWIAVLFINGLSSSRLVEFYNQCLYIYQLVEAESCAKRNLVQVENHEALLKELISKIEFPTPFILPYPPYNTVQNIVEQTTRLTRSRERHLVVTWYQSDGIINQFMLLKKDNRIDNYTTSVLRILSDIWNDTHKDYDFVQPSSIIPVGSNLYLCEKDYETKTLSEIQVVENNRTLDSSLWINQGKLKYPKYEENFLRSYAFCAVVAKVIHIRNRHNDNIVIDREGNMFLCDKNDILGTPKHNFGLKRKNGFFGGFGLNKVLQSEAFKKLAVMNFHLLAQHSRLLYALFGEMLEFGWNSQYFISHNEFYTLFKNTLEEKETIEKCTEMVEYFIGESERFNNVNDFIHILKFEK